MLIWRMGKDQMMLKIHATDILLIISFIKYILIKRIVRRKEY
jgi:beta-lactamase regulating signal transducer with metallopeptidase domain